MAVEILTRVHNTIYNRFAIDGGEIPFICYALNPNILSDDDYNVLKLFNIDIQDIDDLFLGILAVYFRKFFEESDSRDVWQATLGDSIDDAVKIKALYREWFATYDYCGFNKCGQKARIWVPYQCWLIKADSRGQSSRFIKNNQKIYHWLRHCDIFNPNKNIVDLYEEREYKWWGLNNIDEDSRDDINSYIENREYLRYIWENETYRKIYLLTLKALALPLAERENLPEKLMWLKPIVGLTPDVKSSYSWQLCSLGAGTLSPSLVLDEPGDLTLNGITVPKNDFGVYHMYYLNQLGIDVRDLGDNGKITTPFLLSKYLLFKARGNKELISEGCVLNRCSFYLFYPAEEDAPCVSVGKILQYGDVIEGIRHDLVPGMQFNCQKIEMHRLNDGARTQLYIDNRETNIWVQTQRCITLSNESVRTTLSNVEGVEIDNPNNKIIRFTAYGADSVRVNGQLIQPQYLDSGDYALSLHDYLNGETKIWNLNIEAQYNGAIRRLKVLLLPQDWKRRCSYRDLHESYRRAKLKKNYMLYTAPDNEQCEFSCPLEQAVCYWISNDNEYCDCIDEKQYNSRAYRGEICPGNTNADFFICSGDVQKTYPVQKLENFLLPLFQSAIGDFEINSEIEVKLGNQLIYKGRYLPRSCFVDPISGKLYCHPNLRRGNVQIRHENYYISNLDDASNFVYSVALNELKWKQELAELPDVLAHWPQGIIQFLHEHRPNEFKLLKEINQCTKVRESFYDIDRIKWLVANQFKDPLCLSILNVMLFQAEHKLCVPADLNIYQDDTLLAFVRRYNYMRSVDCFCGVLLDKPFNNANMYYYEENKTDTWWQETSLNDIEPFILNAFLLDVDFKGFLLETRENFIFEECMALLLPYEQEKLVAMWNRASLRPLRKLVLLAMVISAGETIEEKLLPREKCVFKVLYSFYTSNRFNGHQPLLWMVSFFALVRKTPAKRLRDIVLKSFGITEGLDRYELRERILFRDENNRTIKPLQYSWRANITRFLGKKSKILKYIQISKFPVEKYLEDTLGSTDTVVDNNQLMAAWCYYTIKKVYKQLNLEEIEKIINEIIGRSQFEQLKSKFHNNKVYNTFSLALDKFEKLVNYEYK